MTTHTQPDLSIYALRIKDRSLFGRFISWWTGEEVNHTAWLIDCYIYEVAPSRNKPIFRIHKDLYGPEYEAVDVDLKINAKRAKEFLLNKGTIDYDMIQVISWPFRKYLGVLKRNNKWICTEVIYETLKDQGSNLLYEDDLNLTPKRFLDELEQRALYLNSLTKGV